MDSFERNRKSETELPRLPDEMWLGIFRYLDTPEDVLRASAVSQEWEEIMFLDSTLREKLRKGRKQDSRSCTPILPENKLNTSERKEHLLRKIEKSSQEDLFKDLSSSSQKDLFQASNSNLTSSTPILPENKLNTSEHKEHLLRKIEKSYQEDLFKDLSSSSQKDLFQASNSNSTSSTPILPENKLNTSEHKEHLLRKIEKSSQEDLFKDLSSSSQKDLFQASTSNLTSSTPILQENKLNTSERKEHLLRKIEKSSKEDLFEDLSSFVEKI